MLLRRSLISRASLVVQAPMKAGDKVASQGQLKGKSAMKVFVGILGVLALTGLVLSLQHVPAGAPLWRMESIQSTAATKWMGLILLVCVYFWITVSFAESAIKQRSVNNRKV